MPYDILAICSDEVEIDSISIKFMGKNTLATNILHKLNLQTDIG